MKQKSKIRLCKVLVIILSAIIIALLIIIAQEVQFRNRYVLPRSLRLRLLNGSYPSSPAIYINDEAYKYSYFSESKSEEYLDKLPDTIEELSQKENDLKIVTNYIRSGRKSGKGVASRKGGTDGKGLYERLSPKRRFAVF